MGWLGPVAQLIFHEFLVLFTAILSSLYYRFLKKTKMMLQIGLFVGILVYLSELSLIIKLIWKPKYHA